MKPVKHDETKIIIIVPVSDRPYAKKPKLNPAILKAIRLIVITAISWLNPEATIAIASIKLLFILLEYLDQNKA